MIQLPSHLFKQYQSFSADNGVSDNEFADYLKWLRYFLDFSEKYQITGDDKQRIDSFLDKLRQKGQSEARRQQAGQAVLLYFTMIRSGAGNESSARPAPPVQLGQTDNSSRKSLYNVAGYQEKSDSPEWDEVIGKLADEIKVRHYSRKTLKTYALWSRQFQRFLKNKPPAELTTVDVKEYLTYLAVKCHVAASTQNQAFCIG